MNRLVTMLILATWCAAVTHLSARELQIPDTSCLVATASGDAQGLDRGTSCAFLGIPFAAPPTGNLRWRRPQPAAPWAPAVLNATIAPANCASLNPVTGLPSGAEDCLKLNLWTPNPRPARGAPVIVWFHPGSFATASANFPPQNGQNLAALTGAIVVAPNYRLGAFGYLGHSALAAEDPAAGNYGLLDQRAALTWVRDHIASFGGNPDNVTIAGQSAGGHSVSLHLVSPGSAGLFHRAIMQSGYASFRWRTAADARTQGDEFAAALSCAQVEGSLLIACLRSKSRDQILLARPPAPAEQITQTSRTQWTPIVDGFEIPDQPRWLYEQGAFNRVPVLLGATRDEGWMFVNRGFPGDVTTAQYEAAVLAEFDAGAAAVLAEYPVGDFESPKAALAQLAGDVEYFCEARRVARLIARTRTPVFRYSFEYEVDPVVPDRVVHGFDVNFVFGNNFGPPLFASYTLNAADLALSTAMAGYWSRFAATGNPNLRPDRGRLRHGGDDGEADHVDEKDDDEADDQDDDDDDIVRWRAFEHSNGKGRGSDKVLILDSTIRNGRRLREVACDFWEPHFLRSVTGAVPASRP